MEPIYIRQAIPSMPTGFVEAGAQDRQSIQAFLNNIGFKRSDKRKASNLGISMGCLNTVLQGQDIDNILSEGPYGPFLKRVETATALQINFKQIDVQQHQQRDNLSFFTQDDCCFFMAPRFNLVLDTTQWQAWVYTPELEYVPIDQAIRLCVLFHASFHNCFFVHGCAVNYRDKGFLFTGKSGVGKTTLANSSEKFTVLNDEMVLVDCAGDTPFFCGTPFRGGSLKSKMTQGAVEASGTMFLIQAPEDSLTALSTVKAVTNLGRTVFQLHGCPDYMERTLDIITEFCSHVPAFDMKFTLGDRFLGLLDQHFFYNTEDQDKN